VTKPWTVQDAKTHLSEILRRARAGEPQRIGIAEGCVVVSERVWRERSAAGLGAWLVASAPRGEPLPDVERGSRRAIPFSKDDDDGAPTELVAAQDAR
jgi:antitoxin (DNA-binding transcriptional repressor) of toxin-antitoxin stability system